MAQIRQKDRNRHSMRVDLKEGDYEYLKELLSREDNATWSVNYLVQVIVNRWVSLHAGGGDIGVLTPPDTSPPDEQPAD